MTVLFADLVGSTAIAERLDPELVREVLDRYAEATSQVVRDHGGTIEKFIGDAVMAVFGVPQSHEDDAAEALRAGLEVLEAIRALNADLRDQTGVELQVRVGVATGEVLVGDHTRGDGFATGDAVNVAARLQTSADVGTLLADWQTVELAGGGVEHTAPIDLEVKGRREPVHAARVTTVGPAPRRRHTATFVGREQEHDLATAFLARAAAQAMPATLTLVGAGGVGKTRFAEELTSGWPARRVVRLANPRSHRRLTQPALRHVAEALLGLGATEQTKRAVEVATSLIEGAEMTNEVVVDALRSLAVEASRVEPILLLVDDVQWAPEPLLALVRQVQRSTGAIAVIATARQEAFEGDPGWGSGPGLALTLPLTPLGQHATRALVSELLPDRPGLVARVVERAGGHPLFAHQLASHAATTDDDLPATVGAVIGARLDALPPHSLELLLRLSVAGPTVPREMLQAVVGDAGQDGDDSLEELRRRGLLQVGRAGGVSFTHGLVQEVAYTRLPRRQRAREHLRLSDAVTGDATQSDLAAFHAARAVDELERLGVRDDLHGRARAVAHARLALAGRRAYGRAESSLAIDLLRRAIDLAPEHPTERVEGAPLLAESLEHLAAAHGDRGEISEARRRYGEAIRAGGDSDADPLVLRCRVAIAMLDVATDPTTLPAARDVARRAAPLLERAGDVEGAMRALFVDTTAAWITNQYGAMGTLADRAQGLASEHGGGRALVDAVALRSLALMLGPEPAPTALAEMERLLDRSPESQLLEAYVAVNRAVTASMVDLDVEGALASSDQLLGALGDHDAGALLPALLYRGLLLLRADHPAAASTALVHASDVAAQTEDRMWIGRVAALGAVAAGASGDADAFDVQFARLGPVRLPPLPGANALEHLAEAFHRRQVGGDVVTAARAAVEDVRIADSPVLHHLVLLHAAAVVAGLGTDPEPWLDEARAAARVKQDHLGLRSVDAMVERLAGPGRPPTDDQSD